MIAPEFDPKNIYDIGDYVVQSDKLYRCINRIGTPQAWNSENWREVKLGQDVTELRNDVVTVSDSQPTSENNRIWVKPDNNDMKIPLVEDVMMLPNPNDYGENGQYPRSTGNGIEWVDYGLPSDQQTEDAINAWLDAHPEATTTVQDHSLTYEKFVNGTLGFVTLEMFGAYGDGISDDTNAIQAAVDSGLFILGCGKTYVINGIITSPNAINIKDSNFIIASSTTAKRVFVAPNISFTNCSFQSVRDKNGIEPSGHVMSFISSNIVLAQCSKSCIIINCNFTGLMGIIDSINAKTTLRNLTIIDCDYCIYSEDSEVNISEAIYKFAFTSYNDGYHFAYFQNGNNANISNCTIEHNSRTNLIQLYAPDRISTVSVDTCTITGENPLYCTGFDGVVSELRCINCTISNYIRLIAGLGAVYISDCLILGNVNGVIAINANTNINIKNSNISCDYCGSIAGTTIKFENCTLNIARMNSPGVNLEFINSTLNFEQPIRNGLNLIFRNCNILSKTNLLSINQSAPLDIRFIGCELTFTEIYFGAYSSTPLDGSVTFYNCTINCTKINANNQTAVRFIGCEISFSAPYANLTNYTVPLYLCATRGMIRSDSVSDQYCAIIS